MSDQKTPDALYVPHQAGGDPYIRAAKVTRIARGLLAIPDDQPAPVIAFAEQADGMMTHFVRRAVQDTKLFPKGHPREGEARYEWSDGQDGIKLGYLKAD